MNIGKANVLLPVLTALLVGLIAGLCFQYRDALCVIEVTATSDHDDSFHFYSDHGSGWVKDEWARPVKAGVETKLYFKFHKSEIKRIKFEPLRLPGQIRFESIRITDRIDQPFEPFPPGKISPKKDIQLLGEPDVFPLIFEVPQGAKDPQIYVTKVKEWEFSSRRDLWDSRLPWRVLRIASVTLLLLLPIVWAASKPSR